MSRRGQDRGGVAHRAGGASGESLRRLCYWVVPTTPAASPRRRLATVPCGTSKLAVDWGRAASAGRDGARSAHSAAKRSCAAHRAASAGPCPFTDPRIGSVHKARAPPLPSAAAASALHASPLALPMAAARKASRPRVPRTSPCADLDGSLGGSGGRWRLNVESLGGGGRDRVRWNGHRAGIEVG